MKIIRWILVLPGALVATFLVAFPIHWVVMVNLGGWGEDPMVEIRDESTLRAIELFLQGLFGPFAFVCAAAFIAPSRRLIVSIAAGLIVVLGAAGLAVWINSLNDTAISVRYGVVNFLSNVAGAVGAILLVKHRTKSSFAAR